MKRQSLAFSFIFFVGLSGAIHAANPRLSKSPLSTSIEQPVIAAIYRDSSGFLWIGTQEGLYRFDGANLVIFNSDGNNENWIPSSDIRGISADIDGNILVATHGGGLLIWDEFLKAFVSQRDITKVDHSRLTSLHVAKKGNIWVSTIDNIFLYNQLINTNENWMSTPKFARVIGKPYVMLEYRSDQLLVGSSLGLSRISLKEMTIEKYDLSSWHQEENFGISALVLDPIGNLVIGTDTGSLAVLDLEDGTILAKTRLDEEAAILVSDLLLYENMLLIATDNGLYLSEANLSGIQDISLQGTGLSSSDVISLYQDSGHVWVGTYNGLDILSTAHFELFNKKNSGVDNDILAFAQDSETRMWIGTYGGLYLYDSQQRSHKKFEVLFDRIRLSDQRITSLATSNDKLWIGFYRGGVQVIDLAAGTSEFPEIDSSKEIFVMDISVDPTSQNAWIATRSHGLIRVSPTGTYNYYDVGTFPEEGISIIYERADRLILITTNNRIYEYDINTEKFSLLKFDFGFGPQKAIVFSVNESGNGDLWFGTKDHGLFLWPKTEQDSGNLQLRHSGSGTQLEYSTIYGIFSDQIGNLWCSTQNGIFKLSSEGEPIKRFTIADGLQGNDFSFGASFTSQSGLIYFGGMNGYNRFDPTKIETEGSESPMMLTDVSLPSADSRSLGKFNDLQSLQLTHNDYFVTFQFSVLDFIDAEKNLFRYKLDNFDREWIESGTRNTATYTNLPPGDYVFRAQGANSAGIWNRNGISLNIDVLPPPWYSWWAYLIYSAGLMVLVWGLLRIYRSYVIDRQRDQLAQEMFEAENRADEEMQEQLELQDEIVLTSYQHNLTTLSLVSDFISHRSIGVPADVKRKVTDSSIRRISALSSLEDCLSYQAGGAVADLKEYTDGLFPVLLQVAPVKPETIVTINEVTSMPVPAELASPLSIILYELLENCILHAFEQDSLANYIQVILSAETTYEPYENFLCLSVSDNGVGIPEEVGEAPRPNSGIAIVKCLVDKLGGSLEFSRTSGSLVVIKIPYNF